MYLPSGAGYLLRTTQTTHEGTIHWLLLPRYPCCQSIHCLYAAFRYAAGVYSGSSTKISLRLTMAIDNTVVSSTPVSKYACVVTQILNLQQTFSTRLSIGRHFPHIHQLLLPSTLGCSSNGCSMAFASSIPPLELNAWVIKSLH